MLLAGDVVKDVREVLGRCDDTYTYRTISDAISILANKPPETGPAWQPLLIYINLPVTQDYYITLPPQVETVLRVNINRVPAFPRAQLYEFTMNGPGSEDVELGWSWQERGDTPIQRPIQFPSQLGITCNAVADAGTLVQLLVVLADQTEQWVTYPVATQLQTQAPDNIIDVSMVSKPVTTGPLQLCTAAGALLAVYQPADIVPRFQRIKISQKAAQVRILAKRISAAVSQPTDIIPLNSKMAIVLMAKAIKLYKEDHYQEAVTCEQSAVHFLEEDQTSRLSYSATSGQIDTAKAISATIKNRDTLIAADVYDELSDIFGPIGRQNLFDQLTSVIDILANKTHWDPLLGVMDICVQNSAGIYYVTLPRFVEQVLQVNIDNYPGDYRSRWFQFHLNGLGSFNTNRPCLGFEEMGEVTTVFTWPDPVPMVAIPDSAFDNDAQFIVFGTDANDQPLRDWQTGNFGLPLPCVAGDYSYDPRNVPAIKTIDRIIKQATIGGISLYATDGTQGTQFIGYYWPEDTEPYFRRIRLGQQTAAVRLMYRKRWLKITSLVDPIPLRSRMAVITAARGLATAKTDPSLAELQFAAAVGYLQEEHRINSNPRATAHVQINSLVYGGGFPNTM